MHELSKIFFITFVSDIDNLLILGAILRRHSHLNILFPAVVLLTCMRTFYIVLIDQLSLLPTVHMIIGLILLIISVKLATQPITIEEHRPRGKMFKVIHVLLLVIATDFLICMDSVMIISAISQNIILSMLGMFLSLFLSLLFLPFIIKLAIRFSWINIIAAAVVAQNAVISIVKDPSLTQLLMNVEEYFPHVNIYNIITNGVAVFIVGIGLIYFFKNQMINTHKSK